MPVIITAKAVPVLVMPSAVMIPVPAVRTTAIVVVGPVVAFNATGENHGGAEKDQAPKIDSHMSSEYGFLQPEDRKVW